MRETVIIIKGGDEDREATAMSVQLLGASLWGGDRYHGTHESGYLHTQCSQLHIL